MKNLLYIGTYAYLVLPYLIFVGGWLRQPYSTFSLLLLFAVPFLALKISKRFSDAETSAYISPKTIASILLPVFFIAIFAGAGGWGFQDSDWRKHNSILRDLILKPWPVTYEVENVRLMLTYYVAYHLPAAAVGKLLGWDAANHALFLYTFVGLFLCALWVKLLTTAKSSWFIIIFFLFSGMDVIGQLISNLYNAQSFAGGLKEFIDRVLAFKQMEWWAGYGFAQFSSNTALVIWVPNQSIAGWLLMSLILNDAKAKYLHITGLFYLGLSSLWSPFVALGLVPFVAILIFFEREGNTLRQIVSWPNITGILIGGIVIIYLAGRFEAYSLPLHLRGMNEEQITLSFLRRPERFFMRYALFVVLEFALLHLLLYTYLQLQREPLFKTLRMLLLISSGILLVLPIINWGQNNEPAMRTSIPALFITTLITIHVLRNRPVSLQENWVRSAILGVLIVGGFNACVDWGRHVKGVWNHEALISIPNVNSVETIFQLQDQHRRYDFVRQYVGKADSWFARHLAKQ